MRQVGNGHEQGGKLFLDAARRSSAVFQVVAQTHHFGHQRTRVFAFALGPCDLFGQQVCGAPGNLGPHLDGFALGFELFDAGAVQGDTTAGKPLCDGGEVLAKS